MNVGGMGIAAGGPKRRTGTVHRQIDNSMEEERGGAETPKRRRKREREQMLQGFEYGPALTVSSANFELAEAVFDMLDKDKSGSLDLTEFTKLAKELIDVFIFNGREAIETLEVQCPQSSSSLANLFF